MKKLLTFSLFITATVCAGERAMTVDDLWAMRRINEIALSPDGSQIAFGLTQYDMEANSGHTDIWLVSSQGGEPRQLTFHCKSSTSPQWKPDGQSIAFLSARNGSVQIYALPLDGGEARQLTRFPVDVDDYLWSADGSKIAFSARVHADATSLQQSAEMDKQAEESKIKARIIDDLLFRSWNRWTDGKRTHIFVCDANGENVLDLTPGNFDAPPLDLGGRQNYVFSPDGAQLAFVSNRSEMPAANTNNDIYLVPVTGGMSTNLTGDNKAVDNQPLYSPNGEYIAYRAMARPGFEADQYEIILYHRRTGEKRALTAALDLSPDQVIWSHDSKSLYFNALEQGRQTVHRIDIKSGKIAALIRENMNSDLELSADGKRLFFKKQSNIMPHEIFVHDVQKDKSTRLTFVNAKLLNELEINSTEEFRYPLSDGGQCHGLMVKPPFFSAAKKYPLIFLIHGGPQGMWGDEFHYRWNTSMFAAPGYVVVAINPRGSKGYGQAWCDAVSKDWGGAPFDDLMAGLDYVLENFAYIDGSKMVAAGASYGGFMVNWIATQTDRFAALISHAGVFDQRSMYGATDELWFPEWEFGGTPYENPELYAKWSPSFYAANFIKIKTPMLVIHGQGDYRVPVTQALQTFTALQRYEVPSRLIYFPDETHFVTKPQNARLWWTEVFAWVEKWINN
ncbi:S9 family peptidase [candidate division KSB1 bacterium]|nr:S9 family peptidase [candidate division KSB1 bacterium]RQW03331.1 MAG: S9 family peptidase [candidate division KSB1 bacterium]